MKTVYAKRIRRVLQQLRRESYTTALVISSASPKPKSRNHNFAFRQSSDFFYLTGTSAQEVTLLLLGATNSAILIAPPVDKARVIWEGRPPRYREIAEEIGAELVVTKQPIEEMTRQLRGVECLVYQNEESTRAWQLAQSLMRMPSHARNNLPRRFVHSDVFLEPLRLHKDAREIALIKTAARITNESLFDLVPSVGAGSTEAFLAASLDYFFRVRDCVPAFDTNVSVGSSAATLHHEPTNKIVRYPSLVLIDCGASYRGYASDITRVLPAGGKFTPVERDIYEAVLSAQLAAIRKIRHGVLVLDVYTAAARELTKGLVEVGVLRGKLDRLLAREAYKPYFPHSIGHSLGLDVHDIGSIRGNNSARLEEGMVITIEPGLYFPRPIKRVPAMGVRIEDDVLVTRTGAKVLSDGFPKHVTELEDLMRE